MCDECRGWTRECEEDGDSGAMPMCDYAVGDYDPVVVLHDRKRRARKWHRCDECVRPIAPGEVYCAERYVSDGNAYSHKTCAHCRRVRDWLMRECGGFMYSHVTQDILDHAQESGWSRMSREGRILAAGSAHRWHLFGRLIPIAQLESHLAAAGAEEQRR